MAKKNLQRIASALQPAAEHLPTQNVQRAAPTASVAKSSVEPLVQFSFGLRQSQRKQLARMAADDDVTMRAFILKALKGQGLDVTDDDLLDLRRKA